MAKKKNNNNAPASPTMNFSFKNTVGRGDVVDNKSWQEEYEGLVTIGEQAKKVKQLQIDRVNKQIEEERKYLTACLDSAKEQYRAQLQALEDNVKDQDEYLKQKKVLEAQYSSFREQLESTTEANIAEIEIKAKEDVNKVKISLDAAYHNEYKNTSVQTMEDIRKEEIKLADDKLKKYQDVIREKGKIDEDDRANYLAAEEERNHSAEKAAQLHQRKLATMSAKDRMKQLTEDNAKYMSGSQDIENVFEARKSAIDKEANKQDFASDQERDDWIEAQTEIARMERDSAKANLMAETGMTGDGAGGVQDFISGMLGGIGGEGGGITSVLGNLGELAGLGEVMNTVMDLLGASGPIGIIVTVLQAIAKLISVGFESLNKGIEMYVQTETQYLGKVNSRLDGILNTDGSKYNYSYLANFFEDTFGSNPYVTQKGLIETMATLTESGIAYNLEQRTILATLSDRMVSTFDMLDATLTSLTKLQQMDLSVAELGSQSLLTQFFNSAFKDTSYFNSAYKSVSNALLDASSQLSADESVAFNYAVQKWLGSLFSVGMSEADVTKLASGIAALATGDFSTFEGDDALRNLFVTASGGSYANLLMNKVSASNIDSLMSNIVTQLQSIATDTNQVTRNVRTQVYGGLSLSSVRAASNLTSTDMMNIISTNTNLANSVAQLDTHLAGFAEENTSTATKIDNVVNNTLWGLGEGLVNDGTFWGVNRYLAWKVGGMLPGVIGTAAQGIVGLSAVKDILGNLFGGLTKIKSLSKLTYGDSDTKLLNQLMADAVTVQDRGKYNVLAKGVATGYSESSSIGVSGGYDSSIDQSMYNQSKTVQNGAAGITDATYNVSRDVNDIYYALFEKKIAMRVIVADFEDDARLHLTEDMVYTTSEKHAEDIHGTIKDFKSTNHSDLLAVAAAAVFF